MVPLAIRCHPSVPVSVTELEGWLEQQMSQLRAEAPQAIIAAVATGPREGRTPTSTAGWLVELELAEAEPFLAGHRLVDALGDIRLLGLQPTLLAPRAAMTDGGAA